MTAAHSGCGIPSSCRRARMTSLSCAKRSAIRAGPHRDARLDERGEHVLRHVLVVERDDVDVAREREHGRGVAVVADRRRGERRRHPLLLGEHAQLDAELDRRRDHHAGQLPAADDSDSQRHGLLPVACAHPSSRTRRCAARAGARSGRGLSPAAPGDAGGSGCASRCARIWLTSTWSTRASCTSADARDVREAQRLVDAVREREGAGAPHALQDAAALLDRVPAHVRELASASAEDAPTARCTRRVVIV